MQAVARAQPNIALVKYWGKRDEARNLPATGSISLTLDTLWTRMRVSFEPGLAADRLLINGEARESLRARVSRCVDRVCGTAREPARIESESNFPIGAGLASSASAFAALVVAASAAAGLSHDRPTLARLAGAASGSAARSLYPGIVRLDPSDDDIELESVAAPGDWPLRVVVAVTTEDAKPVSSGDAMRRSAATSPFYGRWLEQQAGDLREAHAAVESRDFERLAAVSEHNCLKMHSVMWTSRPPVVYWNEATVACMEVLRRLRADGVPVFFTIDAGPQVKAICLPQAENDVDAALSAVPGVRRRMSTGLGDGARIEQGACKAS